MPRAIPNTTVTSTQYSQALTFAGTDIFEWGYITVANNPVFAQLLEGQQGQANPQDEQYLPPATYPIVSKPDRPVAGIRFRANSLATPLPQVFGNLYYPADPGIQAGTPFTGQVSASGAVGAVGVIDKDTALIDVAATNVETDIFNFSVPGGALTSDGQLRFQITGDYLYNNVAGNTCTIRIYLGGVLQISYALNLAILNANRRPWQYEVNISGLGATNSQMIFARQDIVPPDIGGGAAPLAGIGGWDPRNNTPALTAMGLGTPATIDMTVAQTLRMTAQWSAASANNSWRKRYAILEAIT